MWEYSGEGIVNSETTRQQMAYFRLFHLNPLKVVVTLSSSAGADSVLNLPPSPVTVLLETLLGTVANLDAAPLCFNSLYMENPFVPVTELQSRIVQHYRSQLLSQIYRLLGSFDIIGSPVSLVETLGTGVFDFFHEPAEGLVHSPRAFGKGLAVGTMSLLNNTVYGLFNTAAKIAGSVTQGLASMSFDPAYLRARELAQQRERQIGRGVGIELCHGKTSFSVFLNTQCTTL